MPRTALENKLSRIAGEKFFSSLSEEDQSFLLTKVRTLRFSHQETRKLCNIAQDLRGWGEETLEALWPEEPPGSEQARNPKAARRALMQRVEAIWDEQKSVPKKYDDRPLPGEKHFNHGAKIRFVKEETPGNAIGKCPVASEKTRCCNLMTLDAVRNCGFDCSYCSIQTFYHGNQVIFHKDFAKKLAEIELDPGRRYHIGTGQSSDSLIWGNREGVLDQLFAFAERQPNVVLEFKTKSQNIGHMLQTEYPRNIICTWSLNTPPVIINEELLTPSLDQRLDAARRIADRGRLVGFHFHPIVHYDGWKEDYPAAIEKIVSMFRPEEVAMISLGTITLIKPVIRQIRNRTYQSKILQMQLVDANGKLSYPHDIKLDLFKTVYQAFESWHDRVFFYLCMEGHDLWQPVFGHAYRSNEELEAAMLGSYFDKIEALAAP